MQDRRSKGEEAEELAAKFLKRRGLKILDRNLRLKKGELDILAREGKVLCVVEVRSRGKGSPFIPEEQISPRKIKNLEKTVSALRSRHRLHEVEIRMDLLVVDWETGDPEMRYYPGGIPVPHYLRNPRA